MHNSVDGTTTITIVFASFQEGHHREKEKPMRMAVAVAATLG